LVFWQKSSFLYLRSLRSPQWLPSFKIDSVHAQASQQLKTTSFDLPFVVWIMRGFMKQIDRRWRSNHRIARHREDQNSETTIVSHERRDRAHDSNKENIRSEQRVESWDQDTGLDSASGLSWEFVVAYRVLTIFSTRLLYRSR
jgi:hypothetical protein